MLRDALGSWYVRCACCARLFLLVVALLPHVRRLILIVVMTDDCDEHHITHEEYFIPITLLVLHFIIQVAITLPFIPSYSDEFKKLLSSRLLHHVDEFI